MTKIGKYDKTGEEIKHLSKKGIKNFEKDYLKRGEPSAKTKIVKILKEVKNDGL